MGSNSSLSVSSRPDAQDAWELGKPASLVSSAAARSSCIFIVCAVITLSGITDCTQRVQVPGTEDQSRQSLNVTTDIFQFWMPFCFLSGYELMKTVFHNQIVHVVIKSVPYYKCKHCQFKL